MEALPVIKFKYLAQRQIHLGDGRLYEIPYRLGPKLVNGKPDPACQTSVPIFDMDFIHEVELLDEKPELPEREDWMDDDYYKDLSKESYKSAHENRATNNKIRRALAVYEQSGTLTVVEDPFKTKGKNKPQPVEPAKPVKPFSKQKPNAPKSSDSASTPSDDEDDDSVA